MDVRQGEGRVVLGLHGELDLLGAPMLERGDRPRLRADEPAAMVLDLRDLQFVDSAGLRVILAAHERSRREGKESPLPKVSEQVQRLFTIAGVSEHLRIIGSPDDLLV